MGDVFSQAPRLGRCLFVCVLPFGGLIFILSIDMRQIEGLEICPSKGSLDTGTLILYSTR
jgi:hypothetical protein